MIQILIDNVNIQTPDSVLAYGWLLTDGARIAHIGTGAAPEIPGAEHIDGGGGTLLPGFIDMHVHGSVGYDVMDANAEGLRTMARFFASCGVTGFLATTVTASAGDTLAALRNVADYMAEQPSDGAAVLGAHVEGPYINIKAKGAQEGAHVRLANPSEYAAWFETGVVREVTVAPEFPANMAFLRECAARGIVVSLGHTQATYEQAREAFAAGARQATHTFNAMTGLHHRAPGVVGAALSEDAILCELIADGIHVHPAAMKVVARAKGLHGVVLITDAIRGAGMEEGLFELGGQPVYVKDGMACLSDGTLAGSVLTMDRALRTLRDAAGLDLAELWPMSSANAARQLGLGERKGSLRAGFDADLTLLDAEWHVRLTVVGGQVVFRS